jgi:hypothetical protein
MRQSDLVGRRTEHGGMLRQGDGTRRCAARRHGMLQRVRKRPAALLDFGDQAPAQLLPNHQQRHEHEQEQHRVLERRKAAPIRGEVSLTLSQWHADPQTRTS